MTDTTAPTLANFVRMYAANFGWPVHPLHTPIFRNGNLIACSCGKPLTDHKPGKHPRLSKWEQRATNDPAQVEAWWKQWPDANIGFHVGGAGLVALDFDVTKPEFAGHDLLQELVTNYPTITAVSGSGGRHLFYKLPQGMTLGNTSGELAAGVDTKSNKGNIVLPPSVHPSGNKYQWLDGFEPWKLDAAPLPPSVLALLTVGPVRDTQPPRVVPAQQAARPDDAKLLKLIRNGRQGAEFDRLWAGDTSRHGGDQSAADSALLRILAFWTGKDAAAMDRLFRQSGLYRQKWERQDYRERYIEDAIDYTPNVYTPPQERDQQAIDAAQAAIGAGGTGGSGGAGSGQSGAAGSLDDALNDAACTDTGNAICLDLLHGDKLRYCHTRQTWLLWDGWRWRADNNGGPTRLMLSVARARYHAAGGVQDLDKRKRLAQWAIGTENHKRIESGLKMAGNLQPFATNIDQWDTNPHLLATPAGTVDLRTGALYPPRQSDYISLGTSIPYDPDADCPRWRQFLHQVFGGDQNLIAFIQRAAGYSLTGLASEQALFLAYGRGANGKSTFLEVLALLAGDFHAAGSFDSFDVNERNAKRDDLAALVGKRLLTIVESDEDRRLSGAKVKSVTGNDPISCRHLHGRYFTYTPIFKPWFATNFKPMISDDTDGMWRRVRLIPFPHSFAGAPDRQLAAKLRAELPGILAWAVEGARQWYGHGLGSCGTVDAATAEYRADSDILGLWIEECCKLGALEEMDSGAGYYSYRVWAQTNGYYTHGNNVMSAQAWGRRMGERPGITKQRRRYYGISV